MTESHVESGRTEASDAAAVHRRAVHAERIPQPAACGCGLPLAFDVDRKEFFCIGCGASKECLCAHSLLASAKRPVNVA